jgi:FAD/FMN-containing dehydrogenase
MSTVDTAALEQGIEQGAVTLDDRAVEALKGALRGEVLRPQDTRYEQARKIWNGMIDRHPALIAQCTGTADVLEAVRFAQANDLRPSVRAGGHNVSGNAMCEGGLVIDLSRMKGIRVDATARTVRAQPGLTWGDFDRETQVFGLATTGGIVSTTGIAGLTLGGGVGWLVRKHGLACDNLLSVDVVTADGRVLVASEAQNSDLFWGVRGGGGNFGIVTSLEYRLHPVGPVLGGMTIHPQAKAREVLRFYRDFVASAPEEITTYAAFLTLPDGLPAIALVACYCGAPEAGEIILQPLRSYGPPLADTFQAIPYVAMQSMLDAGFPYGIQSYWKSSFLRELSDSAIDILVDCMSRVTSPLTAVAVEFYGGASGRLPEDATAFPHRQAQYNLVMLSMWQDPADSTRQIAWTRQTFDALQPFSSGRVYVNALGQGEGRIGEAFGANYPRLVELKKKYDPQNFFRFNQNIQPTP